MLAQKKKGKIIELNLNDVESNEFESFTMLKLSREEAYLLISSGDWDMNYSNRIIRASYETNTLLNVIWNGIATQHQCNNPNFIDVCSNYSSLVKGDSFLIRDPLNHTIKIVKQRNKDNNCSINKLLICNEIVSLFFEDIKNSESYKMTGKWEIAIADKKYEYWDGFMNLSYLNSINLKSPKDFI